MKKVLLSLGVAMSIFTMSAYAGKTTDRATVHRNTNKSISTGVHRAPSILPIIDVVFDSDDLSIEFISSVECEATVYLYDMFGNLIYISESLNSILNIPESIITNLNIVIEAEYWYATATITI